MLVYEPSTDRGQGHPAGKFSFYTMYIFIYIRIYHLYRRAET